MLLFIKIKDKVKRNKYYKNKKVYKLSVISVINVFPLNIIFNNGTAICLSTWRYVKGHSNRSLLYKFIEAFY